jgi:hypothetical protein
VALVTLPFCSPLHFQAAAASRKRRPREAGKKAVLRKKKVMFGVPDLPSRWLISFIKL